MNLAFSSWAISPVLLWTFKKLHRCYKPKTLEEQKLAKHMCMNNVTYCSKHWLYSFFLLLLFKENTRSGKLDDSQLRVFIISRSHGLGSQHQPPVLTYTLAYTYINKRIWEVISEQFMLSVKIAEICWKGDSGFLGFFVCCFVFCFFFLKRENITKCRLNQFKVNSWS